MNENDETPQAKDEQGSFQTDFEVPKRYKRGGSSTLEWDTNLAHSKLAVLALLLAELITVMGCIVILCAGVYVLCGGLMAGDVTKILYALIVTPIAFGFEFAMFVVFARVGEL